MGRNQIGQHPAVANYKVRCIKGYIVGLIPLLHLPIGGVWPGNEARVVVTMMLIMMGANPV